VGKVVIETVVAKTGVIEIVVAKTGVVGKIVVMRSSKVPCP
jgi:hypothetical protein